MVDGSTLDNGVKVIIDLNFVKGGLISESISLWLQSLKKSA